MSQSNIEHLFQLTAGALRVTGVGPRPSEGGPSFGDHFSCAAPEPPDPAGKEPAPQQALQPSPPDDNPTNQDNQPRSTQNATGDRSECGGPDRPRETSGQSSPTDENSEVDPNADTTGSTEQAAHDDENSSDDEHSDERSHEAEQSIANVASAATVATLAADAASADVPAEDSATTAATSSGETSQQEQPADEAATTKEQTLELAAKDAVVEHPTEQLPGAPAQSTVGEEPVDSAARTKSNKSPGAGREAPAAAVGRKGQKHEHEHAAARDGSLPAEASVPTNAVSLGGEDSTADSPTDDTNPRAEESKQHATTRATPGGSVRSPAAPNNVAAASVAPVQSGEAPASGNAAADAAGNSTKSSVPKADALANLLGRPHSGSNGVNRAGRAGRGGELPRVDPARFIGRVAKAFQTAHERGGTLQLRLNPPELGSLRLELTVKEGVMSAALETETTAARRVLLDHLPALRDRLAQQNIRVERFDVDVRRDGSGGQADGRAAQHQHHNHQPDQPPPRRQPMTQPNSAEPALREAPVILTRTNSEQINLVA